MNNTKGIAVITGASSGIGAVYADRLARRGYDLVLVARNLDKLVSVAEGVHDNSGREVSLFPADLTDAADLARVESLLRTNKNISILVNNAGVAGVGTLLNSDADQMNNMISLNAIAPMRLAYAAVPGLVARKSGTIINIASVVAIQPELLNGVYGGTKAFMLAFSQSLAHELKDTGVKVQVVLPGATATDLWANAGRPVENLPKEIVMRSEDMVDAALAGLDQGEFVTIPALQDDGLWKAFENARQGMFGKLSVQNPAARYRNPLVAKI